MNIFDMFDLDGDGLLDQNEYNYYAMASGDSAATDGAGYSPLSHQNL